VLAATHGPRAVKKARGRNHRFSRIIRHSLRDGFNAYSALSLGTGLYCSHRPRDHLANLTPASGCQDHTPSRPPQRRSPARRPRARRQRVHRNPASRVVTIAIRPLHRGGMGEIITSFWKTEVEFFRKGKIVKSAVLRIVTIRLFGKITLCLERQDDVLPERSCRYKPSSGESVAISVRG